MTRPRVPLAPVEKTRLGAVTTDGKWSCEQLDDGTTSWQVVRRLAEPVVVADFLGSLRACRAYIASGEAERDLGTLQAHARGEHAERAYGCASCDRDAEAAETARQLHGRRAA